MVDKFEVDMKQYIENEENFRKFTSLTNNKISIDDFSILTVIGKGSYGKVLLVKKNDDQKVYAMKVLKKKSMIRRNQTEHIKTERRVLVYLIIN
jgi:serine/threonine protein kinase